MQRIVPNIWFDHTALEAAEFYVSVFPDARITGVQRYPTEGLRDFQSEFAGQPLTVMFEIGGYRLIGINAGSEFPVNPSISFTVSFDTSSDVDAAEHQRQIWAGLSEGGTVLMPLGEYPFAPQYGWVSDRYGVSWQLLLTDGRNGPQPFLAPSLMFCGPAQNRAGEAMTRYAEVFAGESTVVMAYPEPTGPAPAGAVQYGNLTLLGQPFTAMDSGVEQDFTFSCGVSLMVECADQVEIDRYWAQLSEVPEAEACGWCADRFGVSWQIVPARMDELMGTPEAFHTMMGMKKIEIAAFG